MTSAITIFISQHIVYIFTNSNKYCEYVRKFLFLYQLKRHLHTLSPIHFIAIEVKINVHNLFKTPFYSQFKHLPLPSARTDKRIGYYDLFYALIVQCTICHNVFQKALKLSLNVLYTERSRKVRQLFKAVHKKYLRGCPKRY